MILIKNIFPFWITFNLSDLKRFIILCFAKIANLALIKFTILLFWNINVIINLTIIATFFYKTSQNIYNYFFVAKLVDDSLFASVFNDFEIIKNNDWRIFYLYYLV